MEKIQSILTYVNLLIHMFPKNLEMKQILDDMKSSISMAMFSCSDLQDISNIFK
jgi:hypothetical protein